MPPLLSTTTRAPAPRIALSPWHTSLDGPTNGGLGTPLSLLICRTRFFAHANTLLGISRTTTMAITLAMNTPNMAAKVIGLKTPMTN